MVLPGDRVAAGSGDDADTGVVLRVEGGDEALVAWTSGVRTRIPVADLQQAEPRQRLATFTFVAWFDDGSSCRYLVTVPDEPAARYGDLYRAARKEAERRAAGHAADHGVQVHDLLVVCP